jgi:hypothetical protein
MNKMQKRFLLPVAPCTLLVGLMMLSIPLSVFSADLAGTWKAEFDTQIGIQKYTFTFEQTEAGIAGTASSDIGGEKQTVQLTDIKQDSNQVSFVETLSFQGMDLIIQYHGTVSENEMKLTRDVGEVASEELVAKREEAAVKE